MLFNIRFDLKAELFLLFENLKNALKILLERAKIKFPKIKNNSKKIKEIKFFKANFIKKNKKMAQSKINAEKIDNFDVKKKLSSIDLIINSSSLGHHSNPGNPLPEIEMCKEGVIFFDAIYTPLNTLFLKKALKSNFTIISGLDLFLFQGFESFMLFTNRFDLKDELFLLYEKLKSNYSNFLEKA